MNQRQETGGSTLVTSPLSVRGTPVPKGVVGRRGGGMKLPRASLSSLTRVRLASRERAQGD